MIALDDYGRFTRGIATGANKFFVLRSSAVKAAQLEYSECLPCLTRSAQVKRAVFSSDDYECLLRDDAPVLLFSAGANHSPASERYIRLGEADGYHKRFLTKSRTPWYKTEIRSPAPILVGVFSRGGYKVIRNRNDLNGAPVPSPSAFDQLDHTTVERAMAYVEEKDCVPDYINEFFGELVNV